MKNFFVTHCINSEFLKLMIEKFPKEKISGDVHIITWSNEEVVNLRNTIRTSEPNINFQEKNVFETSAIFNYTKDRLKLSEKGQYVLENYELVFKLLLPLYYREVLMADFIFADDDTITTRDPFIEYKDFDYFTTQMLFDKLSLNFKLSLELWNNFTDIFDLKSVSIDDFNKHRSDAGIWGFFNYDSNYSDYLKSFLESDYIVNLLETRYDNKRVKYNNRVRTLDQRFLSFYFLKRIVNDNIKFLRPNKTEFHLYTSKIEKFNTKKLIQIMPTFIHYAASGQKHHYVKYLREKLIISKD